jgi:phosphate transport system substrate-binding protein
MKIKIFALIVLLFVGCGRDREGKNEPIAISGAFALYPLTVRWAEEYRKIHPEVQIDISAGGAGKGLTDALAGAVDLGMFSRAITPAELAKGVWSVAVTKDAVLPTISAKNPYRAFLQKKGMTREQLTRIFITGEITSWKQITGSGDEPIHVFTRSDACGAAETWAAYLGGRQEGLKGTGIYGDPGLASVVADDPYGIGFNNTIYVYDDRTDSLRPGMEVAWIDVDGNGTIEPSEQFYGSFKSILQAIGDGKYPSPPARDLYFVAGGQPQKQSVRDFLAWILSDGQRFVAEAGYVPLRDSTIRSQVTKLGTNAQ